MKFAKELERDAVPEWRIKYLNYKAGKKYVKAVSRAVERSPGNHANHTPSFFRPSNHERTSILPLSTSWPVPTSSSNRNAQASASQPKPIPSAGQSGGSHELPGNGNSLQYGSFVPTPPILTPVKESPGHQDFALPAPAMRAPDSPDLARPTGTIRRICTELPTRRLFSTSSTEPVLTSQVAREPIENSTIKKSPSRLQRIFSHAPSPMRRELSRIDSSSNGFDLVKERERQFYEFMDSELHKVESFYKTKEEQAGKRLSVLRQQLHEMRNRRIHEMSLNRAADAEGGVGTVPENSKDSLNGWVKPIRAKIFPPGPNSKALSNMPTTPSMTMAAGASAADATRDYSRRRQKEDVSYRTAKRKLKMALQEFYRGLELLKSYALLNRTAFRKLNKKFDKAANARPPMRFMNERVNKAWFVNSEILDGHIKAVEDLYARYFERGNHKVAAGKLRSLAKKSSSEAGSSFLNGFLLGTGLIFNIEGVVSGSRLMRGGDGVIADQTSFLLQIYAGYFLILFMFSLFCINCFVWTKSKINYTFIFEFDQRHLLDWRRLARFPSFFFLLLGIIMWMNFRRFGHDWLYTYYPVFLICITAAIIFFPGRILYYQSRKWFVYAHWRLLLAGLYPVEFRDFFLGDMYCSLTYAMANVELFFCLYAHNWNSPSQCNSTNSRILGFLMTLPPIWRFFQCLRRYHDTRNVFPHLVNGGKYIMTIAATMLLSIYRIHNTRTKLALFVAFSVVNGIYVSIWDLFMDFSLLQTEARYRGLRDILALKSRWPYYLIMVIDPILRFAWIFYAVFTHDTQHSTIVAFAVSFIEVLRRGMWALFRVENEHCANVSQYKASRDVPLPYRIEPLMDRVSSESSTGMTAEAQQGQQESATRPDGSSTAVAGTPGTLRRRDTMARGGKSISKILAEAHKQDFVKRKRPGTEEAVQENQAEEHSEDDDDDDDDDDDNNDDNDDDDDDDDDDDADDEDRHVEAANLLEAGEARELRWRAENQAPH